MAEDALILPFPVIQLISRHPKGPLHDDADDDLRQASSERHSAVTDNSS